MIFSSMTEFLDMGGHGLYVWSAYGICLVILALNVIRPISLKRQFFIEHKRQLRREERSASDS